MLYHVCVVSADHSCCNDIVLRNIPWYRVAMWYTASLRANNWFLCCSKVGQHVHAHSNQDWEEDDYMSFCWKHAEDNESHKRLLSMCGIDRLLQELQSRQMDHMLTQRGPLLTNLQSLASTLNVQVMVSWLLDLG